MPGKELENRLIDIKLLLEHGITHMNETGRTDRMLAVHHAHQAVELSLRIKAEEMGFNPYKFPDLIKRLKKPGKGLAGIIIPYERKVEELNKTRALIQHYGQTPDFQTVIQLVTIAKEAIIDFWKEQFNIDYYDISLLNQLQDKDLLETLNQAEIFLKEKKYDRSVELSILAIYKNIWKLAKKFPPPAFQSKGELLNELMGYGSSDPFGKWDAFLYVVLSLPYASKLKQLRQKTGIVYLGIPGGKPIMQQRKDYKAQEPDAFYAFSIAVEYSLWIEQMYF